MSTPAPEPSPYGRLRIEAKEGDRVEPDYPAELEDGGRVVSLRALLDALSMWLIAAGGACGVAAAWLAGGTVAGLATLGGVLAALGLLLTL